MSLYGYNSLLEAAGAADDDEDVKLDDKQLDEYVNLIATEEMSRLSDDDYNALTESGKIEMLQERQVLNKKSMMRLSRADDEKRRVKLIAYKLAKEDNNPHWKKMVLRRGQWREERDEVLKRYGKKAQKIAKIATKEYIKRAKKEPNKPALSPA